MNLFPDAKVRRAVDPSLIPDAPSTQLIERPYFRFGSSPNSDAWMYANLFDPGETVPATDYLFKSRLPATLVPSKQLAVGGREKIPGFPVTGTDKKTSV